MSTDTSHPKIFISHASEDKPFVRPFAEKLRANGVDAWIDEWEIKPGDKIVQKIFVEGIDRCDAFLVVLSKTSVEKPWVKEELDTAVVKRIEEDTKIIPIRIDDCEVPAPLRATAWQNIDPSKDYEEEFQRVLSAIFNLSRKPILGERPVLFSDVSIVGNYTIEESRVLGCLIQQQYKEGYTPMTIEEVKDGLCQFSPDTVRNAVEVLEVDRLVEVRRFSGSGDFGFSRVKVTPYGFIEFGRHALDFDPKEDVQKVLAVLASEGRLRGEKLNEILGIGATRINYAIRYLQGLGYVKCPQTHGVWPYVFYQAEATVEGRRTLR